MGVSKSPGSTGKPSGKDKLIDSWILLSARNERNTELWGRIGSNRFEIRSDSCIAKVVLTPAICPNDRLVGGLLIKSIDICVCECACDKAATAVTSVGFGSKSVVGKGQLAVESTMYN